MTTDRDDGPRGGGRSMRGGGRGVGSGRGMGGGGRGVGGGGRGMGGGGRSGGGRGAGLHRRDGSCRPATQADATPVAVRARLVAVVVRPEECTACELCVDACPRAAIAVDEIARVDLARCDGCGTCVTECPNDVFALQEA